MGTLIRNGRGSGVVIATGVDTEFGVIFAMMQDVRFFLVSPFSF
jgi:Ca2+-transporting ATPase